MRPLAVINGILLGSSLAITLSLALVLLVFLILGDEHARLEREFVPLTVSVLIFLGMTIVTAASFYTLLTRHRARVAVQVLMWLALLATGWYYWP